uniref:Uncharacterized protein n=1 Tax=Proboscia inermis TaxID=420281 RepID=A0A7S0CC09_9STRA
MTECGTEDDGEGLEVLRERLEYVLRGHAANVPQSRIASLSEEGEGVDPRQLRVIRSHKSSDGGIHVEAMNRLVERMENEGELYLKQKYSKVMVTPENINDDDEEDDELEDLDEEEETPTYPESNPCVSTLQYELLLDALAQPAATLPTLASLTRVSSILAAILSQHTADGGVTNVNFHSVPTVRVFNAAIKHSSMMETVGGNEKERDGALQNAFTAFDALYQLDACVKRNDETYALLLKVVSQQIPTSRSKGNVLRSLYEQCKDEGVVSAQVLEVLKGETGNSEECDDWIEGLGVESLTPRQTMNVERRRIA